VKKTVIISLKPSRDNLRSEGRKVKKKKRGITNIFTDIKHTPCVTNSLPLEAIFLDELWEGALGVYKITVILARWVHFGMGGEEEEEERRVGSTKVKLRL
jgi:hypothetical protein